MKRSRLRFRSKDRAKLMRRMAAAERAFLDQFPRCWFCTLPSSGIHHMACGGHRQKAISDRRTWASACSHCNQFELTDYGKWPLARQLAVKSIQDPEFFDREAFNSLRGRGLGAIDAAEVQRWRRRELRR